ncbi:MAG: ABC transporter permease subunit [Burkholderiaceae bacterium]|nr:ABC transporter permease subunit [Burkholderiaceae bacterium]
MSAEASAVGPAVESSEVVPSAPSPLIAFWHSFSANRGALLAACFFLLLLVCVVFAGWLAPHDPIEQFRDHMLTPPCWADEGVRDYLLGTDELGRDILSRLIYGARVSLMIGLMSVLTSMLPGIVLGLSAAFYPRRLGVAIMRVMDVLQALPSLLLAICVITVLGPGLINTMIAVAVSTLPGYTRLTRATALAEIGKDYVTASRVAGAGTLRLMFDAVLPNCMAPLIVNATLGFSSAILETAALGFLGLGVQPPTPEWGTMLSAARDYIQRAPWVVTMPGLTILVSVLSINLIGDGLRDALDPKLKRGA